MNDRFLRNSLRANAVFSTLSGLLFSLASGVVASFLGGVPPVLVLAVGLQLLLFAGALVWLATRPTISVPLCLAVIAADVGWVLGTLAVLYIGLFPTPGAIAASLVGGLVLLFALLQWVGVRRLRPA